MSAFTCVGLSIIYMHTWLTSSSCSFRVLITKFKIQIQFNIKIKLSRTYLDSSSITDQLPIILINTMQNVPLSILSLQKWKHKRKREECHQVNSLLYFFNPAKFIHEISRLKGHQFKVQKIPINYSRKQVASLATLLGVCLYNLLRRFNSSLSNNLSTMQLKC